MSVIPLRQRTPSELLDAALQLYRLEPLQFIVASALIYVPWIVVQVAFGISFDPKDSLSVSSAFVALIGTVVVYVFVGGVTTIIASDVYLGRQSDIARAFRTVATRLGSLAGAMFVSGIVIMLGFLALIVPGIYLACRFFAVRQAVLLESVSAPDAMSRSSSLSTDDKWRIFVTFLFMTILVGVTNMGGALLVSLIPSSIAQLTIGTLLSAVLYPFFGITETLLYYDTRIRREGFDVEYLASAAVSGESFPASI